MSTLIIDTATDAVICGLISQEYTQMRAQKGINITDKLTVITQELYITTRAHTEVLTGMIEKVLLDSSCTTKDIDTIIVGNGPGAFTGLRVGLATGIALASALQVPIYPSCSLDALAVNYFRKHKLKCDTVTVIMDARRKECFWAQYRSDGQRCYKLSDPVVAAPANLAIANSAVVCSQRVYNLYPYSIDSAAHWYRLDHPDCDSLYRAHVHTCGSTTAVHPLYLRKPDAIAGVEPKKVIPQ